MRREYAECALLALPPLQETAPVVILEAMAAGKPVVATDVGGVRDLIEDGRTGYVVPASDPSAMADRIRRLLSDEHARVEMGRQARLAAARRFRRDAVADRYRAIYLEVAGRLPGLAVEVPA